MAAHRAPLGYRPPIPLAILAVALGLSFGCSKHEVPPTKPLPPPVLTSPRIAYSDGPGEGIHLLDPLTGVVTNLPQAGPYAVDPAISPDGTRIAFTRVDPLGRDAILTMAVDGSDIRPWPYDSTTDYLYPRWSPNGEYIAFTWFYKDVPAYDVYVARADGSARQRVTTDGRSIVMDWSPDGTRILVARNYYHGLATYAPDGSDMRVLVQDSTAQFLGADYTSDGSRIVVANGYATGFLETMNADGSNRQRLQATTQGHFGIDQPSWSPDGQSVVFPGWIGGQVVRLFVYHLGDTEPKPVFTDTLSYGIPDWGPKP